MTLEVSALLLMMASHLSAFAPSVPNPMIDRYILTDCRSMEAQEKVLPFVGNASIMGSLLPIRRGSGSDATFECDPGLGIRIAPNGTLNLNHNIILESDSTIEALQEHYAVANHDHVVSGLTLAFWLSPTNLTARSEQQTILTIDNEIARMNDWWTCAPLRLSQFQQNLLVSFRDSSEICRHLIVRTKTLQPNVVTHVIVSFNASSVSVYMDGITLVPGAPRTIPNMSRWEASSTMRLFGGSKDKDATTFTGWIQQFDIYDHVFTAEDGIDLYKQGIFFVRQSDDEIFLPSSRPKNQTMDGVDEQQEHQEKDIELVIAQDDTQGVAVPLTSVFSASVGPLVVAVQVTHLPGYGILMNDENGAAIVAGENISPVDATRVMLRYRLYSGDYFNAPTRTGQGVELHSTPDSFTYRWVTLHPQTMEIVHNSDPLKVSVHVIHVNHKPILSAPNTTIQMPSNNNKNDVPPTTPLHVVTGEFAVSDPLDFDLDRVRIDVSCQSGQLTLNPAYRYLADFDSCRLRSLSNWQCIGTGVEDRRLIFLALPTDVHLILHNLQYQAFATGIADVIIIRMFDGVSSPEDDRQLGCLYKSEHDAYSIGRLGNHFATIHRECWTQDANIPIQPYGEENPEGDDGASRVDVIKEFVIMGVVVSAVVCCSCGWCRAFLASCLARGRDIQADSKRGKEDEILV